MMKNHEADLEVGFFIKTDFKAVFPRNGHAASVGVNKPKKLQDQAVRRKFDLELGSLEKRKFIFSDKIVF